MSAVAATSAKATAADRGIRIRPAGTGDRPFLIALAPMLVLSSPSRWRNPRRLLADYVATIDGALCPYGSKTAVLLAELTDAMPRGYALLVETTVRRARAARRYVFQIAVADGQEMPVRVALTGAVHAWARACGGDLLDVDGYWRGHPACVALLDRRSIAGETPPRRRA